MAGRSRESEKRNRYRNSKKTKNERKRGVGGEEEEPHLKKSLETEKS